MTPCDALHHIRIIGNFAAHPEKTVNTGAIVDVEPGEAEWTLDVLESLFDFNFVRPAQLAARKAKGDSGGGRSTETGRYTCDVTLVCARALSACPGVTPVVQRASCPVRAPGVAREFRGQGDSSAPHLTESISRRYAIVSPADLKADVEKLAGLHVEQSASAPRRSL